MLVCVGKGQSWLFNKIVYVTAVSTVWSHAGYVDKAGTSAQKTVCVTSAGVGLLQRTYRVGVTIVGTKTPECWHGT